MTTCNPNPTKGKRKLKTACWLAGTTIAGLARELGYSRHTVYEAWRAPHKYPLAWPRISNALNEQAVKQS